MLRKQVDNGSHRLNSFPNESMASNKNNWRSTFSSLWFFVGVWLFGSLINTLIDEIWVFESATGTNRTMPSHSRSKRFIMMTSDRRLNLPPGTILDLESTASLPGLNPLPVGLSSETAISIPFDVNFDELGFTSEENTFGRIPFVDTISEWLTSLMQGSVEVTETFRSQINRAKAEMRVSGGGGERSIMFQILEDSLSNLGINGKACLLRAICEVHAESLFGHGLFGEIVELFLSVSSSTNYLHRLAEYLEAEIAGRSTMDCSRYKEECPLSLFAPFTHQQTQVEQSIRNNFIEDESNYANYHLHENIGGHGDSSSKITKNYLKYLESNSTAMNLISRKKRFIFFGPAGRLNFPLGTILIFKPQLKLPWMTNLPEGYSSGLAIGVPMRVIFNDLGLTSTLNPFMRIPFLRRKRETWRPLPGVNYEGGDRELIYSVLEHMLSKWGIDGESCLLRAVCEVQQSPIKNYGFFGEALQLFLTPSNSPHSYLRLKNYVEAENLGRKERKCHVYYNKCPHSIFLSYEEKNRREAEWNNNVFHEENHESSQ